MDRKDFLESLAKVVVDNELVSNIQKVYGVVFPEEVQQLVSFDRHGAFVDGDKFCRLLAFDEIVNAKEELHVDFVQHAIVPLFDIGDNNFVVFNFRKGCWNKFNIVDEIIYGEKALLIEVI